MTKKQKDKAGWFLLITYVVLSYVLTFCCLRETTLFNMGFRGEFEPSKMEKAGLFLLSPITLPMAILLKTTSVGLENLGDLLDK